MDLQLFIVNCYREQLKHMKNVKYVLWERGPWECLDTFFRGTDEQKQRLGDILNDLMAEFSIERPLQSLQPHDLLDVDISNFGGIVAHFMYMLKSTFKRCNAVYVFLAAVKAEQQLNSIIKRGRPSEVSRYRTEEDLSEINQKYIQMFRRYGTGSIIKIINKIEIEEYHF